MSTLSENIGGRKRLIGGPFGSKLVQSDYQNNGIPVIRGGNMEFRNRWIGGEFAYVSEEKVDRDLSTNLAHPGDIIVTQRGTLGQVSIVPPYLPHKKYVISQSQMAINVDTQFADPDFVYYFLRSPDFLQYIENAAIKTGVPHINLGLLRETPVQWPDLKSQQQISSVLSALDDKIELNRRMNETLEALAQAIFKDWFVTFGPTRRKMEGANDPVAILGGLIPDPAKAAPVATLFPDNFGDDGLPEGWEEASLGDVISVFDSKRVPLSARQREAKRGAFPYHGAAGVMDYVDEFLFEGVHVLVGEDGSVIDPNGKPVLQYVWGQFWVNNHAHVLQGRGISTEQLLCLLRQIEITPFVTGAVQPKLSQGNLKRIPFVLAKAQVFRAFAQQIAPLFELVRSNAEENRTLAETRDYLLPKLMSGAVRVRDVEPMAE